MWSRVGKFSIGKDDFFELLSDLVNRQKATELNMSNLSIRKIYSTISAMNADVSEPLGSDGEPILEGQLVAVSSSSEIYRYNDEDWELLGTIGDLGMYYTQSEIDVITGSLEQSADASMAATVLVSNSAHNYRGHAEPNTEPVNTLINDVFIANKDGDYSHFSLAGVKMGQILKYTSQGWVILDTNLQGVIVLSQALASRLTKMSDDTLQFNGFVYPNSSLYKGIEPPDPSVSSYAYIAVEDGDYDDFSLTNVKAGDLIRPNNGVWAVNVHYSSDDLRKYII